MMTCILVPFVARANGTHKRLMRSELSADVTCTKKDKSQLKVHVLADALKTWLVRAPGGDGLVAQDVSAIEISSVDKAHHLVKAKLTYVKGPKASEDLKANSVVGTDENQQDQTVALTDCKLVTIVAEKPPRRSDHGGAKN